MRTWAVVMTLSLIVIGSSGCLSLLQPVEKDNQSWNFIDWDGPAIRLAEPVHGVRVLVPKVDANGKKTWVPGGRGDLPAGAYIKGQPPKGLRDIKED